MTILPPWLFAGLIALLATALVIAFAWRNTKRQIARTLARRRNPTRAEFLQLMAEDVSSESAEFVWSTALAYLQPRLTPHPDDNLMHDLPIDHGDWRVDWPRDFAKRHRLDLELWPDWPEDWAATLRNYGRWLDLGLNQGR